MWFEIFLGLIIIAILCFWKIRKQNAFWIDQGVIWTPEKMEPKWGQESIHDVSLRLYNNFQDSPFFGSWAANNKPCLVIRDIELIKSIFIKDFDHFSMAHHMVPVYEKMWPATKHERLILNNLQTAHGDKWKNLRYVFLI